MVVQQQLWVGVTLRPDKRWLGTAEDTHGTVGPVGTVSLMRMLGSQRRWAVMRLWSKYRRVIECCEEECRWKKVE